MTTTTPRPSVKTLLRAALALLTLTALTLTVFVARQDPAPKSVAAPTGDVISLTEAVPAHASSVTVPGAEIVLGIGHPLTQMQWADINEDDYPRPKTSEDDTYPSASDVLTAPEGGMLVPVSWRFIPTDESWIEGKTPISVRVVSGDQSITVLSEQPKELPLTSLDAVLAAMSGQHHLSVEVEYDGVVQRVDAVTGEVDPGAAHGLYDNRAYSTSCVDVPSDCNFAAASPDQQLLPSSVGFIASNMSAYGYDFELGWPPEGTVWVASRIQIFGGYVYDSAGETYGLAERQDTQVQLRGSDGTVIDSTLNELTNLAGYSAGRVVFAVPTEVEPTTLVLRQRAKLDDDPRRVPLVARVPLS